MGLDGAVVTKGIGSQLSSVRIKAGSGKLKCVTDLFYFFLNKTLLIVFVKVKITLLTISIVRNLRFKKKYILKRL